jgi:hypothetical protein
MSRRSGRLIHFRCFAFPTHVGALRQCRERYEPDAPSETASPTDWVRSLHTSRDNALRTLYLSAASLQLFTFFTCSNC